MDWGGTHLRALLIAADGRVIARRETACGAISLGPGEHPAVLEGLLGDWRAHGLPVLVCGMAGARNGWRELAYRDCPAGADELRAGLVEVEAGIRLVPGVKRDSASAGVEVMRGEETQVLGAIALDPAHAEALVICPGTHSKWVRASAGRIADFRTCITGELFAALAARWSKTEAAAEPAWPAFDRGLAVGLRDPLSSALFSVRSGYATRRLDEGEIRDYLSGVLIGAEIAACRESVDLRPGDGAPTVIVGAPELARRYARALAAVGAAAPIALDADACVAGGLSRILAAGGQA